MTHKQHPLKTGFTAAATADEVLVGIDLSGKNVIVTGGHAGIGLEVTRALSKAGASMTVGSRNPDQAALALAGIEQVEVIQLDLLDPQSIDAFAARWLESGRPLHILINGAGASGGPVRDARGYEKHFATNHLGHFLVDLGSATRTARCPRCPCGQRVLGCSAVRRHSVGRPELYQRTQPQPSLRPVQDRQRPIRRRTRPPLGRGQDTRLRRTSRRGRRYETK